MKRWMSALLALAMCASAALAEPAAGAGSIAPEALSATAAPEAHAGESGQDKGEARQSAATEAPAAEAESLKSPDEKVSNGADGERKVVPGETPNPNAQSGTQEQTPTLEGAEGQTHEGESTGEPTGDSADERTGDSTDEATGEPTGEPAGEPTDEATGEPTDEVTGEPTGEPTDEPGAETAAPEGYALIGGERKSGTLAELLAELLAEPGQKTLYLLAKEPVTIPDFKLALLQGVTLLPDPEVFPGEKWVVKLTSGGTEITPEAIAAAESETVALTISVSELPPEPVEPGEVRLTVTPQNYTPGAWMNWYPEFQLKGIPEGSAGYSYVVVIYNERLVPLDEDAYSYIPMEEGVYTVRFAIWDAQGDVVDKSDVYELKLDLTPPQLSVEVSEKSDCTMTLSATDEPGGSAAVASGVAEFSLDGGETWAPLGEGESVVHTEPKKKVFPPKTILVRDLAGNISGNEEEVVLDKLPTIPDIGGDGSASPTAAPHASGDGNDSPYAAYELALPEGAVDVLTLGGEEIDLGLAVDGNGHGTFTAELAAWAREEPPEGEAPKDTLIVRAQARGSRTYSWRINGSVLRKLYNSDIAYLALAADNAVLSLPTVGFTAGTKYAELKMGGVSTTEFEYEITMRTGEAHPLAAWNLSADCAVEIAVLVAGERFEMADREATPEMYAYDVYCGPEDLTDYPYGAYPREERNEA